jgi:transcriptional regulator with XRE-family HTH domain
LPARTPQLGRQIKKLRGDAGLSLSALAEHADVSKSYLWKLERGEADVRPSGQTLYKIARALGTSMSELLGRAVLVEEPRTIPRTLRRFAEKERLGKRDVQMLAGINFRGRQPQTVEDWEFIWRAIQKSVRSAPRSSRPGSSG